MNPAVRNRNGSDQGRRDYTASSRADRELRLEGPGGRSRDHHLAGRRHCPPARPGQGDGRRAAELSARHCRTGAEPRRGPGGRRGSGRLHRAQRRRRGQAHRQDSLRARGRGDDRPRGERAGPAHRRQGPDRLHGDAARGAPGSRHHRPPAGARADGHRI